MIKSGSRNAVVYQIYPRSFGDSNGDGVGDLDGMGYDVSDFRAVAPEYGDLAAMDRLIARAKHLGIGVLLDIVPCHS